MEETILPVPSEEEIEAGKAMALVSWISMFVGLPLWIIPMIQRDNAYALYHAKHSGMTFLVATAFALAVVLLNFATCGFLFFLVPLMFVTWVPVIDGLIKAIQGRVEPPIIVGGFTDQLFGSLTVDPDKRSFD